MVMRKTNLFVFDEALINPLVPQGFCSDLRHLLLLLQSFLIYAHTLHQILEK